MKYSLVQKNSLVFVRRIRAFRIPADQYNTDDTHARERLVLAQVAIFVLSGNISREAHFPLLYNCLQRNNPEKLAVFLLYVYSGNLLLTKGGLGYLL